ncbi:hypothetical protein H5410_002522 [Solanum commersonii]|uniref:ATP-dependent DNA helicase n=1 Tax=Solanum commersonii TaxID=4109 RepID=A0A9J6B206_SOLCO|nr:hypothetical protein H5410_002522 [Solanum commersonii]
MSKVVDYRISASLSHLFAMLLIYCSPIDRDINEFKLILEIIKASALAKEAKDVYFERNNIVSEDDLLLQNKLSIAKRRAYNVILDRIFSNKYGAFFIDGPRKIGKSFLYRALLATIRYGGFIASTTASSGVAGSLLPGGRIAHSILNFQSISMESSVITSVNKVLWNP